MTGVKATKETVSIGAKTVNARVYIVRKADASFLYTNWDDGKDEIYWKKYQIKETDMRVKTATFTSDTYLDLTTGSYCVLITSPYHEDFAGVILSVERDKDGLYNYQCQDFTRNYQFKPELVLNNVTLHRLLQFLLTSGGVPLTGDATKAVKNWKNELSGLRPAYQYDQKSWGSIVSFNPMTQSLKDVIKGKSAIEIIRDYCFGCGAYIDVYPSKYGAIQIEPYHKDDWLKSTVEIPYNIIQDMKVGFNTTNIITGVNIQASDELSTGDSLSASSLVNLDLQGIFGNNTASISNPNKTATTNSTAAAKTNTTVNNTSKNNTSTATAKKTNGNPYNTKKKKIYLNSDNIVNKSTDKAFLNNIAAKLKKQGWSTKVIGVDPNFHTEKYMKGCTDGVWFCVYGGADAAVFKETVGNNSYTKTLKKNNLRTVIGMKSGCDIRKGGKCYKYLKRAHDDNYSPSSFKGVSYPLDMLTKGKVPIMYASTVDKMVSKFLAGGDNPKSL